MPEREVKKIAAECLRPLNQGLQTLGSATNFRTFVEDNYIPLQFPLMAKSSQGRTSGIIKNYLMPAFGSLCLRDVTSLSVQRYLSGLAKSKLAHESRDKIKDVLSSILASAKQFDFLVKNPVEGLKLPKNNKGKRSKPYVTPEQFNSLVDLMQEPYSSMVYVAVWTGLRVSELIGLRWKNVHQDSITIEERICRGDVGAPKSEASCATIAVGPFVIERMQRLKALTVEIRCGGRGKGRTEKQQLVKSCGPDDLVFQSVRQGVAMRDNNILSRHIKPAGKTMGIGWVNWRCLRTSHATWLIQSGATVKDTQGLMRHSRASTTMDVYAQIVPESQHRAVENLGKLAARSSMVN